MKQIDTSSSIDRRSVIILVCVALGAFFIGLVIPSPFFRDRRSFDDFGSQEITMKDTTGMVMPDGAVYEGSLNARTNAFHGYGILHRDGSDYEGNWRNGRLPFGKRTTGHSEYEGRFNDDLENDGFGIVTYKASYINGKRRQGMADNDITAKYIGNWKSNLKQGLGRAVMVDGSMEFGHYRGGHLQKVDGAKYSVGGNVYGIDVSRHQNDIDWDNLALFCDANGNVYRGKPGDDRFMQPVFFAYMKATEGATIKDRTFDIRMIEAERHGIAKGAYHFLRLGSSIDEQIKNFTETANWSPGDMPPALDVELESEIETHGVDRLLDMTYTWLEAVEEKMGVRPIIYTRENIRDKYLRKDPRFAKYHCWIARYHPDGPVNKEWKLWQMSETGRLNGYDGKIDINLYKDDHASFTEYLNSLGKK